MTSFAARKNIAAHGRAAAKRYDREAAAHLVALRVERAVAGAAADAERAAKDAAAPRDIASIEPGDTVRDRYGWYRVVRCHAKSVTLHDTWAGNFRRAHADIIETRKAAR